MERRALITGITVGFGSMVGAMVEGGLARHGAAASGRFIPAIPAGS
jgi:hypothetical protein